MSTEPVPTVHDVTRLWWLVALFGVAVAGVGIFFVADPHETLSTFTVIAGIFLLVDGVLALLASLFGRGEGRGLVAILGLVSVLAGLILIKRPFDTLVVFVLIVGIWFVIAGIARLVAAFSEREGRGGNLLVAALDIIAGVVILAWPDLTLSTFAVILGIVLILRGILLIWAGWQLRRVDHALAADVA
jgi:uncharacterized membrane protein HdeD (DUF308 family)